MSDTLFGGEVSGTPIETRAGTRQIGGRLAGDARFGVGFDPMQLNFSAVGERLLTDPRNRLEGLFAAMEPFERRQTDEAVAGLRGGLGRLGARFGSTAMDAEGRLRGELAGNFARSREQSILEADALQSQTLGMLLSALLQGRGQTLDFFRPGQPNFREGAFGDLIAAGGNVVAAGRVGGAGG